MTPACPLCRHSVSSPFHEEAGHRYHQCSRCGFVFLHPAPSPEELERIYQEEAGATFHHGAEIAGAFEKRLEADRRLRIVRRALQQAPERSALEIGCGAGYLLDRLRGEGWRVEGTELSDAYVRFARERLGLKVGRERSADRFGAVLLFNLLSHVPDPAEEMRACRRNLLPGGVLVLETGNVAEVKPSRVGSFGAPEHLWHFSESTLRKLLADAGFVDVAVRRFNVEWQRRMLAWAGVIRNRSLRSSSPPGGKRREPDQGPQRLKRVWIRLLLALRFTAGRWGADPHHFCTLFVTARVPPA